MIRLGKGGSLQEMDLIEWYWKYGIERSGTYAISRVWLDRVYSATEISTDLGEAIPRQKAAVGLWGPSQSGKSTFISAYVDAGVDTATGKGGALDWGEPAAFSSRRGLAPSTVVINPHNMGSDASGCVSRFVLSDGRNLPAGHPVKVEFFNRREIMHALAAGFISECVGGDQERWSADTLRKLVATEFTNGRKGGKVDRQAFELVRDLVSVVDKLVTVGFARFRNLRVGDAWDRELRSQLLENPELSADVAKAEDLVSRVLWDGKARLTDLFRRLTVVANQPQLAGRPVYCSLEVAGLLLNIDAFRVLASDEAGRGDESAAKTIDLASRLSIGCVNGKTVIGTTFADRIVRPGAYEDFAVLQGAVRELVIPLRRDAITACQPFCKLLEGADILDFPGVALADANTIATMVDPERDDKKTLLAMFTEVLKRGKTSSIVHAYGESFAIDAFVLLMRADKFPAKPQQLQSGLQQWWRSVDPTFDMFAPTPKKAPLPLYVNLTFFGSVINKLGQGVAMSGLGGLVQMAEKIRPLLDRRLSRALATTYPQFDDGKINLDANEIQEITAKLSSNPAIAGLLGDFGLDSLRSLGASDGGVGFLLERLRASVDEGDCRRLLLDRLEASRRELKTLAEEVAPYTSDQSKRKADVEAMRKIIDGMVSTKAAEGMESAAAYVGNKLRGLLGVDFTILAPIPNDREGENAAKYVEAQLDRWIESKRSFVSRNLELEAGHSGLCLRLLGYLREQADVRSLAMWLRDEIRGRSSLQDRTALRRAVAIALSNELLKRERSPRKVPGSMQSWAEPANIGETLHYTATILPALRCMEKAATSSGASRPPQVGDAELSQLLARLDLPGNTVGGATSSMAPPPTQ